MNLKAHFSPILALSLVLAITGCATRKQPLDTSTLPDVTSTSSSTVDNSEKTKPTLAGADNTAQVHNLPIDIMERLRRGFDMPAFESKHVAQYEKWNSEHETYLKDLFSRATPFLYHIVEELDKRNLPMELALLPAVESAYKPTAVSRSKAVGLWQFIPSTGKSFGLRQDWWYDGRSDPLASTKAALDYLTQLNKMFDGDWFLALAAYNAGPGTVGRAIKSNKRKGRAAAYQDLSLRSETRRYIPKLIALKNIINNPRAFGIELPAIGSEPYFTVIELDGQIDLKKFANDAGIEQAELRNLNAGFKRWATSPEGPHRLLIPINASGNIENAKVAAQRAPQFNYSNHRIAQGDSLSSIADHYGVSVKALQASNNLPNTRIRAGKNLLIPTPSGKTRIASAFNSNTGNSAAATNRVHQVKRGDTLWSIARRYKVQINNLLSWNNISRNQVLRLNQTLLVTAN